MTHEPVPKKKTSYVSLTGKDEQAGTKDEPLSSIQVALDKALVEGYEQVLIGTGDYNHATISLVQGVALIGGYDPLTWLKATEGKTRIFTEATLSNSEIIGIKADSIDSITSLENFELKVPDAPDGGYSSYGIHEVNSPGLRLNNLQVYVGAGGIGVPGNAGIQGPSGTIYH